MKYLKQEDPEIYKLIKREEKRQAETLMMIPSENIASKAVEEAVGSALGNKYSEGYSGKRYYQGNEVVDEVESLVIERAKKVYGVLSVNVQPHSGSPANFAVYNALLNAGDTIMGLTLGSGGHLTHGAPNTAAARLVHDFGKKFTNRVQILGGIFEGKIVGKAQMEEIATIPSMQALRGMFANVINSPRTRFAIVLNAVAGTKTN
jgi:glycine/serine hydroxymethyltransferase